MGEEPRHPIKLLKSFETRNDFTVGFQPFWGAAANEILTKRGANAWAWRTMSWQQKIEWDTIICKSTLLIIRDLIIPGSAVLLPRRGSQVITRGAGERIVFSNKNRNLLPAFRSLLLLFNQRVPPPVWEGDPVRPDRFQLYNSADNAPPFFFNRKTLIDNWGWKVDKVCLLSRSLRSKWNSIFEKGFFYLYSPSFWSTLKVSYSQKTLRTEHLGSYLPVDIHFMWQTTFDLDIFRVLVRCFGKNRNMDFGASEIVRERDRRYIYI